MEKINKQRTIEAHKELAEKYYNVNSYRNFPFFNPHFCPLCQIHMSNDRVVNRCKGCPLVSITGEAGCVEFTTYREASKLFAKYMQVRNTKLRKIFLFPRLKRAFHRRAQFHERLAEAIQHVPEEAFTKEGWEYWKQHWIDRNQ